MNVHRLSFSRLFVPLLLVALAGCGANVEVSAKPKTLDGATIAARANGQLDKENPKLTHGSLACADVKYKVGATSRCVRTVVLADGRLVRIGATVTIDKTAGGGHYKILVDSAPSEFGITGAAVLADLSKQYAAKYRVKKPSGSCPPYLRGQVGASIICTLDAKGGKLRVRVEVNRVDAKNYVTEYRFKAVS